MSKDWQRLLSPKRSINFRSSPKTPIEGTKWDKIELAFIGSGKEGDDANKERLHGSVGRQNPSKPLLDCCGE